MSFLYNTGFEPGVSAAAWNTAGTFSYSSTTKRTGVYSFRCNPATTALGNIRISITSSATVYFRGYLNIATLPASGSEQIFEICQSGPITKLALRITSTGFLALYDTTGTTLIATGTTPLVLNNWYKITIMCGNGAAGSYELRINDVLELSGTANLNTTSATFFVLGKRTNRSSQSIDIFWDDILVDDTSMPRSGRCIALRPRGDVATNWTIGAGSGGNYTTVNEVSPDSDTTYMLSTLTLNDLMYFLIDKIDTKLVGIINCIGGWSMHKRDGATNGAIKIQFEINGTVYTESVNNTTAASYEMDRLQLAITNLTTQDLYGIVFGAIERSTANRSRVSTLLLEVDITPLLNPSIRNSINKAEQRGYAIVC